jgi:putative DNA primase/helicase
MVEMQTGNINEFFKNAGIKVEEKKSMSAKIFNDKIYQAELFAESNPFFYDEHKIWWLWEKENFRYKQTDEVNLLNLINLQAGTEIIKSKERTEILNALKQEGRKRIPKDAKESWIQFKNKIYDIETNEELEATPNYFITNPINWELGLSEETLALDILFKSWVGEENYQELYELLAFCIVPNYFIHRIFCLIGSGANGKSTFLNVLSKFIGEDNITSSSLILLMSGRFEGVKLLKRLACLMGETNFNMITNTDYIKKLTGQDLVRAEYKGINAFDFRNYAKLIIATNSLPPTADKTIGFYRRWKIIDFNNIFKEEREVLFNVFDEEYRNLALKCLNIAKRLWKQRTFTNDGDFESRKQIYEEKSNPMMTFIKDNYEKDINKEILFSEFYDDLKEFLESRGFRTLTAQIVSKQLKNEGFTTKILKRDGKSDTYVIGLKEKVSQVSQVSPFNIHDIAYVSNINIPNLTNLANQEEQQKNNFHNKLNSFGF